MLVADALPDFAAISKAEIKGRNKNVSTLFRVCRQAVAVDAP
jgi:hypothetical protein